MANIILPSKSKPPILTIPSKQEIQHEFSSKPIKPTISFTSKPPKVTDSYLNYLCQIGQLNEAVTALEAIPQSGSKVNPNTYIRLIQSCIDSNSILHGRKLHSHINSIKEMNPFVETKLVGMYAKCGCLDDALKVFENMRGRNLYTWSSMIGALSREHRYSEVVELFFSMMEEGILPDDFLFPKIIQACANKSEFETGKLIHSLIIRCGLRSCERVNNSLLSVYSKCGRMNYARKLFEKMEEKDRVAWNSIISGYCQVGEIEEAHRLFNIMSEEGVEPGLITWNILISSYNQMGKSDLAIEMMRKMESFGIKPDVFTWTTMISGFSQNNKQIQALEFFREMLLLGVKPSGVTITSAVSVCASLKALKIGKELHSLAIRLGNSGELLVGNSLIDMYSKCEELESAQRVFGMSIEKDVYTWNSMIGGYILGGYCGKANDLFMKMRESNVQPNSITWNAMISGYIQNGDDDQAIDLFQKMEKNGKIKRNTASWNSLISGYLQNGQKNKGLRIFRQMQSFNIRPNSVTILSVLPAFSNLVSEKQVREVHGCVFRRGLESELSVLNSLIDTYAKAGNLKYSKKLFDLMPCKDIITWNTIIAGCVLHGCSNQAIDLSEQMKCFGHKPNRGTFVSVITAYGLAKMVDEGKRVFSSMVEDYHIVPGLEHYSAMIGLFGRSGKIKEAVDFIENMSVEPNFNVWSALFTASRNQRNLGYAIRAGENMVGLEQGNSLVHHLLLQTYALCANLDDSSKMKKISDKRYEIKKSLGCSILESKNSVYAFYSGDASKLNSYSLRLWLDSVVKIVKGSEICEGLRIEEEDKEETGGIHSEKLAIAFAEIENNYAKSQKIRIVKNLRMCGDCHQTAKIISMLHDCEVYINDSKCFHHFRNGSCSCGDYW